MNPSDTLLLLPARLRLLLYAGYAVVGALLVATQVGYAAAEVGQPIWLTVAWPVFGSLGASFGMLAGSHVRADTPADHPAPLTFTTERHPS